jgi:hypothetical protein
MAGVNIRIYENVYQYMFACNNIIYIKNKPYSLNLNI